MVYAKYFIIVKVEKALLLIDFELLLLFLYGIPMETAVTAF